MADSQGTDNNTCVVCFKNVLYYSIGECDHPVCFECSTRMRVLCLQNECPICRKALGRVVFTETVLPYKELITKVFTDRFFERQFKIGFCSEEIKSCYDELLENRCKLCSKAPPFRTFTMLSDHMRKAHERYFCDLCVKHLKIFTHERKCYTRQELAHHRRKGDLDDTSHRGHPLCEFCEERFMDADELYRHLRKEHLYCHMCDLDGKNLYYLSHAALAHHFRTDHYLCEEGECASNHLTAVFRTEIDLKAHKATVHGRGMNRGAARQARTLELQFNITPHPTGGRAPRNNAERVEPESPEPPRPASSIDTGSDAQFPRLSAAPPPHGLVTAPHGSKQYRGGDSLARTNKNFPALDGAAARPGPAPAPQRNAPVAAAILRNSKPSVSIQLHSQPASASNFRLTQPSGNRISIPQQRKPLSDDDFPSLGVARDDYPSLGAGTVQPPKVAMINSQEMQALKGGQSSSQQKRSQLSSEAFPALSSGPAPSTPQWITVQKPKEKAKPKPEPQQKPKEPAFNATSDFPGLPNSKAKKKAPVYQPPPQYQPPPPAPLQQPEVKLTKKAPVYQPAPQYQPSPPAPLQQPEVKLTKKEKKKNAAKKENIENLVNGNFDKKILKELSITASEGNEQTVTIDKKIKTIGSAGPAVETEKRNGGKGDFKLAAKDYPPLSAKAENNTRKVPNGSVPPGFKPRPACAGITFTNSSGQTFSAPLHTYIPPPNFEKRNRDLVMKFAVALGGAAAVEDFKVASRGFRDNVTNAEDFYEHCEAALGSQMNDVFPELVALLPDIAKQQELVVGRDIKSKLDVCSTCGQLIAPNDRGPHESAHWPPL